MIAFGFIFIIDTIKIETMTKTVKIICVAAAALLAMPQSADAQVFKKLKQAAKKVIGDVTKTDPDGKPSSGDTASPTVDFVTSANGVSIGNPGSKHFDVEFVSAVGDKASNTVTVYVKATSKSLNYNNAYVGANNSGKAYDSDGNEYKTSSYGDAKTLTVGVPVKYEFAKFEKVPATVDKFVVVYGGWYLDSGAYCPGGTSFTQKAIQLKNVPVTWE